MYDFSLFSSSIWLFLSLSYTQFLYDFSFHSHIHNFVCSSHIFSFLCFKVSIVYQHSLIFLHYFLFNMSCKHLRNWIYKHVISYDYWMPWNFSGTCALNGAVYNFLVQIVSFLIWHSYIKSWILNGQILSWSSIKITFLPRTCYSIYHVICIVTTLNLIYSYLGACSFATWHGDNSLYSLDIVFIYWEVMINY